MTERLWWAAKAAISDLIIFTSGKDSHPMKRSFLVLCGLLALALAGLAGGGALRPAAPAAAQPARPQATEPLPAGAGVQTFLSNLAPATAMVFDPAGRLFYTEKDGAVRLAVNGVVQA